MKIFLSIVLFSVSVSTFAKGPVWKVSKGDDTVYLGGTVHLLTKADYPLPEVFDKAFQLSDEVYFEADMAAMADPSIQLKLVTAGSYQDGSILKDHVKPETYQALLDYMVAQQVPAPMVTSFKPGLAAVMLQVFALRKMGVTEEGVDVFYNKKAKAANKKIAALESVDEQIEFIANLGKDQPDAFLSQTLKDLKKTEKLMAQVMEQWRRGDAKALGQLFLPDIQKFPQVHQSLLVKRNHAWLSKIEAMFGDKDKELVLVGFLHFSGEDGLLALLQAKGYHIEQI